MFDSAQLDNLLDMSNDQFMEIVHARARRRFQRGLGTKPLSLIKKLRKAKKECEPNEKPRPIKTHLRNMIIVPEMIGSVAAVYNGKVGPFLFSPIEWSAASEPRELLSISSSWWFLS